MRTIKPIDVSLEFLKANLQYDPDTGIFYWKTTRHNSRKVGEIAGWKCARGYIHIEIHNKAYKAHRIAWFMHYGIDCTTCIDHENGIKSDNRIINLRLGNQSFNNENRKVAHKNNKSGYLGVSLTLNGKFQARINVSKKCVHIGTFTSGAEAHIAYVQYKRQLHRGGTI